MFTKLQKIQAVNGLPLLVQKNEEASLPQQQPVFLHFRVSAEDLAKVQEHRNLKQSKYQRFITDFVKKIKAFIQKNNKNHLFAEIQEVIIKDPFLKSEEEVNLHDLIRFNQKLVLWFRAFHKQEDIFKKQHLKKKFFKLLHNLTKSTMRLAKFSSLGAAAEHERNSSKDVQEYYNMIQCNQFLSQNLKAHSQNPDKKRSSERTYHRKHKIKDYDVCDK